MASNRESFRSAVLFAAVLLCLLPAALPAQTQVRIKDIAVVRGQGEDQLSGFGIVTGLSGKGDGERSVLMRQALVDLVTGYGVPVTVEDIRSRNSAIVMVTADVPSSLRAGSRLPVTVSSIGDAKSLAGGVLLQTPLRDARGGLTATAQGKVLVAGAGNGAGAGGGSTTGSIPSGAILRQDVAGELAPDGLLSIILRVPDFSTAAAVAEAIRGQFPEVEAVSGAEIRVRLPEERRNDPVGAIAEIESLQVSADTAARVVVDPRSGVVVMGKDVRIGNVAVSWKDTRISVGGATSSGSSGSRGGAQSQTHFQIPDSPTVEEFVELMRQIGMPADAVIGILQALEAAGALYGKLIIL